MSTIVTPNPYSIFNDMKKNGWYRDFDTSEGGHYCVTVQGAPPLGGNSDGNLLYFGNWTKPDGTTLFQRSNMDRSVSTIVFDPMGNIVHAFKCASLAQAAIQIHSLGIA